MATYPVTIEGLTLWACCVSNIGPTCRHREGLPPVPDLVRVTARGEDEALNHLDMALRAMGIFGTSDEELATILVRIQADAFAK